MTYDSTLYKETHVMVDIETLDTKNTAVILSIGAVKFNSVTKEIIAKRQWNICNLHEQQDNGRTISIETLNWWLKQSSDATEKTFNNKDSISLEKALNQFQSFCIEPDKTTYTTYIWGNGNMFDNAILRNAFTMYNIVYPCDFRNDLDLRTIKWLFKDIDIKTDKIGTAHNAVDDAEYQVNLLCNFIEVFQNKCIKEKK